MSSKPTILVTGGAGYIASHMNVELLQAGFNVVAFDNLSNSSASSIAAVQRITQKELTFVEGDLRDATAVQELFSKHDISSVLHFGGLKAVGESTEQPEKYYDNNVNGTLVLLDAMSQAGCNTMVFSSSATVYGDPDSVPINEHAPTRATNPYGRTKLIIEQMLHDFYTSNPQWRISVLRYFNPVGAHACGEIGEDPTGIPNNLMPFISQVAVGRRDVLQIYGNDYPTKDGTGVRDYIHVLDLVSGHLAALSYLQSNAGYHVHNLGTGRGYSVLEVLRAFEQVCGKQIPYEFTERRAGDIAECFADASLAFADLGWRAQFDLIRMCEDTWRWQRQHPNGYATQAVS